MSMVTWAAGVAVSKQMHRSAAQSGKQGALVPGGIHCRECLESSSEREWLPAVYGGGFMGATMHTSTSKRYRPGNTGSTCHRARISSQQWGKGSQQWGKGSHLSYHSYHPVLQDGSN